MNVAKEIGDSSQCFSQDNSPSIKAIKANIPTPEQMLEMIEANVKVSKYFGKIGLRKETVFDGISLKYYIKQNQLLCNTLPFL